MIHLYWCFLSITPACHWFHFWYYWLLPYYAFIIMISLLIRLHFYFFRLYAAHFISPFTMPLFHFLRLLSFFSLIIAFHDYFLSHFTISPHTFIFAFFLRCHYIDYFYIFLFSLFSLHLLFIDFHFHFHFLSYTLAIIFIINIILLFIIFIISLSWYVSRHIFIITHYAIIDYYFTLSPIYFSFIITDIIAIIYLHFWAVYELSFIFRLSITPPPFMLRISLLLIFWLAFSYHYFRWWLLTYHYCFRHAIDRRIISHLLLYLYLLFHYFIIYWVSLRRFHIIIIYLSLILHYIAFIFCYCCHYFRHISLLILHYYYYYYFITPLLFLHYDIHIATSFIIMTLIDYLCLYFILLSFTFILFIFSQPRILICVAIISYIFIITSCRLFSLSSYYIYATLLSHFWLLFSHYLLSLIIWYFIWYYIAFHIYYTLSFYCFLYAITFSLLIDILLHSLQPLLILIAYLFITVTIYLLILIYYLFIIYYIFIISLLRHYIFIIYTPA